MMCTVLTQVSEGVFAGLVEAHGVHGFASSCFHVDVCRRQKLYQNLLHIVFVEQFSVLSYTHTDTKSCIHLHAQKNFTCSSKKGTLKTSKL